MEKVPWEPSKPSSVTFPPHYFWSSCLDSWNHSVRLNALFLDNKMIEERCSTYFLLLRDHHQNVQKKIARSNKYVLIDFLKMKYSAYSTVCHFFFIASSWLFLFTLHLILVGEIACLWAGWLFFCLLCPHIIISQDFWYIGGREITLENDIMEVILTETVFLPLRTVVVYIHFIEKATTNPS